MGLLGTVHENLRPLGLSPDHIKLVLNDPEKCPDGGPAGGSRSQAIVGRSATVACENLLKAMRKVDGSFMTHEEWINLSSDSWNTNAFRKSGPFAGWPAPCMLMPGASAWPYSMGTQPRPELLWTKLCPLPTSWAESAKPRARRPANETRPAGLCASDDWKNFASAQPPARASR